MEPNSKQLILSVGQTNSKFFPDAISQENPINDLTIKNLEFKTVVPEAGSNKITYYKYLSNKALTEYLLCGRDKYCVLYNNLYIQINLHTKEKLKTILDQQKKELGLENLMRAHIHDYLYDKNQVLKKALLKTQIESYQIEKTLENIKKRSTTTTNTTNATPTIEISTEISKKIPEPKEDLF